MNENRQRRLFWLGMLILVLGVLKWTGHLG